MVPLLSLAVPILVSAALVFVASSIFHMVLTYHHSDYQKLPSEDEIQEALRRYNIPPGDYLMPRPASMKDMRNPEYLAKREKGPLMVATILKGGKINMGPQLLQWFVFCVVVSIFAAYIASRTLRPEAPYLEVFRVVGTVAFCGYALGNWPETIWYQRSVITTLKTTIDGLVYGLLSAGVFGWLWPR